MLDNQIISHKKYTSQIGILVSEITLVRNDTFNLTKNLSLEQLDYNFDDKSNSIGTLLLHIAALEYKFYLDFFLKRPFNQSELEKYMKAAPFNMDKRLIHGNDFNFYFNILEQNRAQSLGFLKTLTDDWLFENVTLSNGQNIGNNYYLIKHIIHDELCHQGQIKLILKRLKEKQSNKNFTHNH